MSVQCLCVCVCYEGLNEHVHIYCGYMHSSCKCRKKAGLRRKLRKCKSPPEEGEKIACQRL